MTNWCNGCEEARDVTEYLMDYGGTEYLCTECVRETYGSIVRTMNRDPI